MDMPVRIEVGAVAAAWCAIIFFLCPVAAGASVTVSISRSYAQLVAGQTLQFQATVSGSSDKGIIWQVNNADGGSTQSGTISNSGLFTPPQTLPDPALVTVTAQAHVDRQVAATASISL